MHIPLPHAAQLILQFFKLLLLHPVPVITDSDFPALSLDIHLNINLPGKLLCPETMGKTVF